MSGTVAALMAMNATNVAIMASPMDPILLWVLGGLLAAAMGAFVWLMVVMWRDW